MNQALTANAVVPDGVRATAHEGSVILTGTVGLSAQRVAAEDTAASVGGMLSITNEIVILGAGPPAGGWPLARCQPRESTSGQVI